ncbi:Uncharacterized protein APZ42_009336 [Daphnia magna]|uniref:Uncharacterized protein n=1 Tax=Daphnia magna TaxID=35525 RepID=A0A162CZ13_9CRUS|nr:Uncharacterized protein APZ42_009336 [Daphnia magna]
MLDMLTLLLKDSAPSQPELSSITELFQLPMKDLDDAKNFEKLLRVQNNKSKTRTFFIGIRGTTNTIVGRVIKSIMTYECGSCFCYVGLNEDTVTVAFKTSTICDIVHDGVCEMHKSMTRDAVESNIKNWLRHCPRYALKNNEDRKINGEEEHRQDDSDYNC